MLPSDLLTRARNRLGDLSTPPYWSNSELLEEYANAAIDKLFSQVRRLVVDSTTANDLSTVPLPLCTLSIVAGTSTYAMSPKIIDILTITLTSTGTGLSITTVAEMDKAVPGWRTFVNSANQPPWACITDLDTDSITLFPKPPVNDTASLTVNRRPLQRLELKAGGSTANNTIPLGFREEYHDYLIPGIMAEAYSKSDSEVSDPGKADLFEKRFNDNIDKIKNDFARSRRPSGNATRKAYRSK